MYDANRSVATFARSPNGGLIVTGNAWAAAHDVEVVALAARPELPTIYSNRTFAIHGDLISYGANFIDQYRLAAGYVDRILKGETSADLPVQAPTGYELVVNLKTAKTLGLVVPQSIQQRADEVIEE